MPTIYSGNPPRTCFSSVIAHQNYWPFVVDLGKCFQIDYDKPACNTGHKIVTAGGLHRCSDGLFDRLLSATNRL
jgi:hypothetical protein